MEEYRAQVRSFLAKFCKIDQLADADDIFALGYVNSLFAMQLILFVEKEFAIKVQDQDLDPVNFRSVDAIVGFVERKKGAEAST